MNCTWPEVITKHLKTTIEVDGQEGWSWRVSPTVNRKCATASSPATDLNSRRQPSECLKVLLKRTICRCHRDVDVFKTFKQKTAMMFEEGFTIKAFSNVMIKPPGLVCSGCSLNQLKVHVLSEKKWLTPVCVCLLVVCRKHEMFLQNINRVNQHNCNWLLLGNCLMWRLHKILKGFCRRSCLVMYIKTDVLLLKIDPSFSWPYRHAGITLLFMHRTWPR